MHTAPARARPFSLATVTTRSLTMSAFLILAAIVLVTAYVDYRVTGDFFARPYAFLTPLTTIPIYYLWKRSQKPTPTGIGAVNAATIVGVSIIILCSLTVFLTQQRTAYETPAYDMFPYYERTQNPGAFIHDFYTNSMTDSPNPRIIFGNIITTLADTLNVHWYQVVFIFRVFNATAVPALLFLVIVSVIRKTTTDSRRILFGISIAALGIILAPFLQIAFTVASWQPLGAQTTAQTMSFVLGMTALLGYSASRPVLRHLGILLMACATFIHPAMSLCVLAFGMVCFLALPDNRRLVPFVIFGVVTPLLALSYIFKPNNPLSGESFIYHYITERHDYHYSVTLLMHSTKMLISLGIILILTATGYVAHRMRAASAARIAFYAVVAYGGAILMQYIGTEVFTLKTIAILGPLRFSMFGYWLILTAIAITAAQITPSRLLPHMSISPKSVRRIALASLTVICLANVYTMTQQDDPFTRLRSQYGTLTEWIETTSPDAIFVVPPASTLANDIQNVFLRAVVYTPLFPFSEDVFDDYEARTSYFAGTARAVAAYPFPNLSERRREYFRTLTPTAFEHAAQAFPFDYILLESEFTHAFADYQPVFKNETFTVYSATGLHTP